MALTTSLSAAISGTYTATAGRAQDDYPISLTHRQSFATGVAALQCDKVYDQERTVATSETLDLAGVLTDVFGAALTFVKIRAIMVEADAANVNDVVVGGAGSNAWVGPFGANTHTVAIQPGDMWMMTAATTGWTVTPGSGDLLKVLNSSSGASVKYRIVIVGTSA